MTQYHLRTGGVPTGNPSSYGDIGKIRVLLNATDPDAIRNAGAAYQAAAQHLANLRDVIVHASKVLAGDWKDEAATATQKTLRELHTTADQLSIATAQMGKTLDWYGGEILPWYRTHKPDTGLIKDGGDDKYAREYMQRLNARIAQAWSSLPESVTVERLKQGIEQIDDPPTRPMTSGAPASRPTATGGSAGGSPSPGHHPLANATAESGADGPPNGGGNGHWPTVARPGTLDGAVTGTDLAGTGGNGITGSPFGGPPTGSGGAPSPFGGPGAGGPPGALPGADPGGLRAVGGRPGGLGSDRFGPGGRGGTASSTRGTGPLSPGGAGAGKREDRQDERRREFWLAEERENWNADPAVAPVIGGASPAAIEYDDEAWRVDSSTVNWGVEPVSEIVLGSPARPGPAQAEPADESDDDNTRQAKDARPEKLEAPPELRGTE